MEKLVAFRRNPKDVFVNDDAAHVGMKCHRFFASWEHEDFLVVGDTTFEHYDVQILLKEEADQIVVRLDSGEIQVWRPTSERERDGIPLWVNEQGQIFALADVANDEE